MSYITVVGGVNVDIGGFSAAPLKDRDSNPGRVTLSLGGVGRNVAHNLCLLGKGVKLATVMGQDANASLLYAGCEAIGMDLSLSEALLGQRTSTYLFIADSDNDMRLAVSDMDIYQAVTPEFIAARMDVINAGEAVVVDTNIPAESIRYLAENASVPVIADPVSGAKAPRLVDALPYLTALKPNALEAGILTGEDVSTQQGVCRAAQKLVEMGVKNVLITMGVDGVCCADKNGVQIVPAYKATVRNATGAGDAFTAGLTVGLLQNLPLAEVAALAQAASVIAIGSDETVSPEMSYENLLKIKNNQ